MSFNNILSHKTSLIYMFEHTGCSSGKKINKCYSFSIDYNSDYLITAIKINNCCLFTPIPNIENIMNLSNFIKGIAVNLKIC